VPQISNFFLWGLADNDPLVRARAIEVLRLLAQQSPGKAYDILAEIQRWFHEMRNQGREIDEQLSQLWWVVYGLLSNPQAFQQWKDRGLSG